MKKPGIFAFVLFCLFSFSLQSQEVSNEVLKQRIQAYKADQRGPYKEIRWYCPDGSIIPPKERCPQPGGVQRARHKDEVYSLAKSNHIFLGQILATTPNEDFWDEQFFNSRLKQYQLEKYLRAVDNGWILRKAQFYRGAYQAEDEEAWGLAFYQWLLKDARILEEKYFLIRQAAKDIPHKGDTNLKQDIRLDSKIISDSYSAFLDIRVKIHGQPEMSDIQKVVAFRESHKNKMPAENLVKMDQLIRNMKELYKPFDIQSLNGQISSFPSGSEIKILLTKFQSDFKTSLPVEERIRILSILLKDLRQQVLKNYSSQIRIDIIDISIIIEDLLFNEVSVSSPSSLKAHIQQIYNLGIAATGCGYLEFWEWEKLSQRIDVLKLETISDEDLIRIFDACKSITEWGTGMFTSVYEDVIELYSGFEPLAEGFMDEKIRSGILLKAGISISDLGDAMNAFIPVKNQILDLKSPSTFRGLNPGIAKGELVVITGNPVNIDYEKEKIYVFGKPPADLKPVAGIASVSEGNPVSHIQLLARNLGIPNAVLSMQNLEELRKYHGKTVFYAVSSRGTVIIKPEDAMSTAERALFQKNVRKDQRISVPVDRMDLKQTRILKLTEVSAGSSGKLCGPKAANLGQLKQIFPEYVVDGLVVPFGIFREHMNQKMPGSEKSYWEYLNGIFQKAAGMKSEGKPEAEIEKFVLKELAYFQSAIKKIELKKSFITDLEESFQSVFNKKLGSIPVFLRSDTNMEDLKDFTGAGLNLTLFNVYSTEIILQGIRDVWASPYSERSYKWRQRFLNNPENVFPSILIIPSVDVDYSGVLVTKGLSSGSADDLTVSFSMGAGGAVDGQAAETYLLTQKGENILLSPQREPSYRKLPASGGTQTLFATYNNPVLSPEDIAQLRSVSRKLKKILPETPGIETPGPFDVELGFKDHKLWLFQVRPFVENKNAASQLYLESLNPVYNKNRSINLNSQTK